MIIDESWYQKIEGIPDRQAAGGVIVKRTNNCYLVLLVTKAGGKHDWILPKGGLKQNETHLQAARREIEEEAGATGLIRLCKLGVEEKLTYDKKHWNIIHYYLFTAGRFGKPAMTRKHYTTKWFPIDKLPQMFWPEQKRIIEENAQKIKMYKSRISISGEAKDS